MADKTKIEWTDATWPVTNGCALESPGCENCYAMKLAHKLGANPNTPQYAGLTEVGRHGPRWNGVVRPYEKDINQPLHWKRPRRIFVDSMSDLFHADVPFDWIDRVFATVLACQFFENRTAHTFQFLTKRSARLLEYFSASPVELLQRWTRSARNSILVGDGDTTFEEAVGGHCAHLWAADGTLLEKGKPWSHPENLFPLQNAWIGVSAENQKYAEKRLADLVQVPAHVRWVSFEPLLGPVKVGVDLDATTRRFGLFTCPHCHGFGAVRRSSSIDVDGNPDERTCRHCDGQGCAVSWIVAGAESGHRARAMEELWVRDLFAEAGEAGVARVYKQRLDAKGHKVSLPLLDGQPYAEMPDV